MNPRISAMSLHASLNPEALKRLESQRRISAFGSLVIAMLSIILFGLVLALVLIPQWTQEPPVLVTYTPPGEPDRPDDRPKPRPHVSPKPAAASMASARVMVAGAAAPVALEVPDVPLDYAGPGSVADDFGSGWNGPGDGAGAGGAGGFGSTNQASGGLEGTLYDFKQEPDGRPIQYDLGNPGEFVERVVRLQRSRFSESALRRHFRAPNRLYLSHLAIPFSSAAEGPSYFGAKDSIRPSGWVAHYRGRITVPKTGSYRFSGLGDDYLVVLLDGRMRLAACWSDIQPAVAGRWDASEPTGRFQSPFHGVRLVYGDWVRLRAGQQVEMEIAIGERPGGHVGFLLHVEEEGVEYRKAADGRPILPLFTTVPFSDEERGRIQSAFGSYEFEWERVPVFPVR